MIIHIRKGNSRNAFREIDPDKHTNKQTHTAKYRLKYIYNHTHIHIHKNTYIQTDK